MMDENGMSDPRRHMIARSLNHGLVGSPWTAKIE
jgi:hypothetical protein